MDRVIIIAGGKGERLRPLTEDRPKCMIPVLGQPLLTFQLRLLHSYGFNKVTLCCGHLSEVIRAHFGDGTKYGVKIDYLVEKEPLGRGGALKNAIEQLGPIREPVLAMNGDILTNINLSELVAFHKKHSPVATLVSVPLKCPYGIIESSDESLVSGFAEKPELPFWVNAGIYVLAPSILDKLPSVGDHEVSTFPNLAGKGDLRTYKTRAFWKAIDTVKDLAEVRVDLEELMIGAFLQSANTANVMGF